MIKLIIKKVISLKEEKQFNKKLDKIVIIQSPKNMHKDLISCLDFLKSMKIHFTKSYYQTI